MTEQEYKKLIGEIDKSFNHITKDNLSEYEKTLVEFVESSNVSYEEFKAQLEKEAKRISDLIKNPIDAVEEYKDKENVKYALKDYRDQKESTENSIKRLEEEEKRTKDAKVLLDNINSQIDDLKKNQAEMIESYKNERDQQIENATLPIKAEIEEKNKKVPTLQNELNDLNKKIDDLNNDSTNKKKILASFDERVKNEETSIKRNEDIIPSFNKRIENYDKEIKDLESTKAKYEERFKKRDSLRNTIDKCEKELPTFENNVKSILSQIDKVLKENNGNTNDPKYKEQFEKLNNESAVLASTQELLSRSKSEIELLDAEYNGDKFIYDKTNIDINTKESFKKDFLNKIEIAKKGIESSKNNIENIKKEKEEFKNTIDKASKTLKEYDLKKKNLESELDSLNKELNSKNVELENVTKEVTNEANIKYSFKEAAINREIEEKINALSPALETATEKYNECLNQENGTKEEIKTEQELEENYKHKLENELTSELNKTYSELNKKINKCSYYESIKDILDNSKNNYEKTDKAVVEGLATVKRAYLNYQNNNGPISRFFKFLPWTKANKEYKRFDAVRTHYMEKSGISKEEVDNYLDNNRFGENLNKCVDNLAPGEFNKIISQGVYYNPISFKRHEGISLEQYTDAVRKQFDKESVVDTLLTEAEYNKRGFEILFKAESVVRELKGYKSEKSDRLILDVVKYASNKAPGHMNTQVVDYLSSIKSGENKPLNLPSNLLTVYNEVKRGQEALIVKNENAVLEQKNSPMFKDEVYHLSTFSKEEQEGSKALNDILEEQNRLKKYDDVNFNDLSNLEEDLDDSKYLGEEDIQEENKEEEKVSEEVNDTELNNNNIKGN